MTKTHLQMATEARKNLAAVRTINLNYRLNRYDGRNSASTEATRQWKLDSAVHACMAMPHFLGGLVWSEHCLAERMAHARELGQERPELAIRLKVARKNLRAEMAALALLGGNKTTQETFA